MKKIVTKFLEYTYKNYYFFVLLFAVFLFASNNLSNVKKHEIEMKQKDQEISSLRRKINNYFIADGLYDRPAREVLPLIKDFGIGL